MATYFYVTCSHLTYPVLYTFIFYSFIHTSSPLVFCPVFQGSSLSLHSLRTSIRRLHYPTTFLPVSYFFSSVLLHQNLLHFPLITPLCLNKMMMWQTGFILPLLRSFLHCFRIAFYCVSPQFSCNCLRSVSASMILHCESFQLHILLNLFTALWLVKCFFLSSQTIQTVTVKGHNYV